MPILRPCLLCRTNVPAARWRLHRERHRVRPTPAQRGYDAEYRKQRALLLDAEPWCHNPRCPYPDAGSAANPLTADHIVPISKGGRDGPLTVLCRSCNSSKRDRGTMGR